MGGIFMVGEGKDLGVKHVITHVVEEGIEVSGGLCGGRREDMGRLMVVIMHSVDIIMGTMLGGMIWQMGRAGNRMVLAPNIIKWTILVVKCVSLLGDVR